MGWIVSLSKLYVEALTPSTSECDYLDSRPLKRWWSENEAVGLGPSQRDWCPYKKRDQDTHKRPGAGSRALCLLGQRQQAGGHPNTGKAQREASGKPDRRTDLRIVGFKPSSLWGFVNAALAHLHTREQMSRSGSLLRRWKNIKKLDEVGSSSSKGGSHSSKDFSCQLCSFEVALSLVDHEN